MSDQKVRVRFAPSPTGPLHIGGVRTCLYNYLFARQRGGAMIFRIEDTDTSRFVPGAEEYIQESFRWLGIRFDEGVGIGGPHGPYRQSERRAIYKEYVARLLDAGRAYVAFDTPEELEAARAATDNFQYDATTRGRMRNSLTVGREESDRLIAAGTPYVVRFLVEPGEDVTLHDIIRGDVTINSSIIDDKVLYKSTDELPTYHLANIVDDHLMEVTHVIRGEEWLPSAPLHLLLYRAFGWEAPRFAHLPLLLKPEGNGKLSKRDGDKFGFPVFPLEWHDPSGSVSMGYREAGYRPEAVINFLALLGWNPGDDREILSMDDLIELFDLEHCSKNGARFDYQKIRWFNHHYLQLCDEGILCDALRRDLDARGLQAAPERVAAVVHLMKERVDFPQDLWAECDFFFQAPAAYDEKSLKKWWKPEAPRYVEELCALLEAAAEWDGTLLEPQVMAWIAAQGYPVGKVMNALRVTLVGAARGPHIFQITDLLGREETLRRARKAVAQLGTPHPNV